MSNYFSKQVNKRYINLCVVVGDHFKCQLVSERINDIAKAKINLLIRELNNLGIFFSAIFILHRNAVPALAIKVCGINKRIMIHLRSDIIIAGYASYLNKIYSINAFFYIKIQG